MMKQITVQPGVRTMFDNDGAILLDLDAGKYFSLNGVAAQIWEKLEAGSEFQEIVSWMESQFGASVSRDRLVNDLESLVRGLEAKGLIRAIA